MNVKCPLLTLVTVRDAILKQQESPIPIHSTQLETVSAFGRSPSEPESLKPARDAAVPLCALTSAVRGSPPIPRKRTSN
jgi:hypothetical protein